MKYYIRLMKENGGGEYSMFDFIIWTAQKEHAKVYTLDQAMKLIREIPAHIGIGELVQA